MNHYDSHKNSSMTRSENINISSQRKNLNHSDSEGKTTKSFIGLNTVRSSAQIFGIPRSTETNFKKIRPRSEYAINHTYTHNDQQHE